MAKTYLPGTVTDSDRLNADLAALSELAAVGVEVEGETQVAESTWVIYGRTSYDGQVIAGEYTDGVEAFEVLRSFESYWRRGRS